MRLLLSLGGILLILAGTVWFLQGINVLPGSFMTRQMEWAVYGAASFCLGVALLVFANRRPRA